MNKSNTKTVIFWVVGVALVAVGILLYQTGKLADWFGGGAKAEGGASLKFAPPELIKSRNGEFGLELSQAAIESLELKPTAAVAATKDLPLPPMIGIVNYDNERLFSIKARFTGEISKFKSVDYVKEVVKNGSTTFQQLKRPIKFGDRVKQGDVIAEFWSRDIGEKKAALVDAMINLRLSKETLERQYQLFLEGAIALAAWKLAERQAQSDRNAVMTAERTLRMWKLTTAEIDAIKDEANKIHDQKLERDIIQEVEKWAKVEVKVPEFDRTNSKRELTILEKNYNLGEMVDPANYGVPLFKIADLSRLQIEAHPPEEYLPILREQLVAGLKWKIRFQSDAAKNPLELDLRVEQIAPSLEPNQHTPMLIGYLDNPKYEYLIGQFVTATILVGPPEDTVEIPTDAVNPLNGKEYVFIENPEAAKQFLIRRVSVVRSLKKISYVRTKLTREQVQANLDVKEGEYKIEPLNPGDRVVTRGVVELTAALEELRNTKKPAK